MKKQRNNEFTGLIDAEGVCPNCKSVHQFKLNPGYPPTVWKSKLAGKYTGKAYRNMGWNERCLYYFFRVLCDRCMSYRATKEMRAKLAEKGWDCK